MNLIRLTPVNKNQMIPIISANWITGMEVRKDPDFGTVIYVARQGLYHVVEETPEQIELMLNSAVEKENPPFRQLINFAQWWGPKHSTTLGRSYADIVDEYIRELRTP